MTFPDLTRYVNNFYLSKGGNPTEQQVAFEAGLSNHLSLCEKNPPHAYRVAFVFICLNPLYWEFVHEMVSGSRKFFLPGHKTDFYFWTDIPKDIKQIRHKIKSSWAQVPEKQINFDDPTVTQRLDTVVNGLTDVMQDKTITFIPTESVDWPFPTLLRYNLFLQKEKELSSYDYIFYCDVDMQFVGYVGDEILPVKGITAALHPMYAIDKKYWPPYEPNKESASYIPRPGLVIQDEGKPRFMPMYFAGGLQGGTATEFIDAMKECKKIIDADLSKQYIPIWNDESAWNKYLLNNPPSLVLNPSYIYPDSLIEEYYVKLWGCNYPPKLKTLTKWFSTSKAGGEAIKQMI